ncbi:DNA repair-scaffolding protein isoform X2 [Trichomycterus rosablanca]|uniref:DNA repair-scaffolding protein isoform X2 n=1 Tax=Trichomycterus rosablanca TaxID=2290929 RepID=UPI002F354DE9
MSSFSKRKRKTRNTRCTFFPKNLKESFHMKRPGEPSKATKSWERCGDSFQDTAVIKATGRTCRAVQHLQQPSVSGEKDSVHVSWSSSEEEKSDSESQLQHSVSARKFSQLCKPKTSTRVSKYCRFLSTGADTDELPTIDSGSEHEENSTSEETIPVVMAEISDYSSDNEGTSECRQIDSSTPGPLEQQRSEWVRSAQALLQTPQKQIDQTTKTPEDSGKKRCKFESRGLAERLNRLQSRQRSAISFWRHQSWSNISMATERPGVLVLLVRDMWEVCGMLAALCEKHVEIVHMGGEPCIALFTKDTATHLAPNMGDTIYVCPPWQSLIVEEERHPIILNTHFSQKVLLEDKQENSMSFSKALFPKYKTRPYPLTMCLKKREPNLKSSEALISNKLANKDSGTVIKSLLEACGPSGFQCGLVELVVQRVYFSSVTHSSLTTSLGHRMLSKCLPGPKQQQNIGRFCMLVQDVYGMFGEVELQDVSSEKELKHWTEQMEGRVCIMQGLKVLHRLTRESCTELFGMIDSLWPPLVSLDAYGEGPCQTVKVPAPSFCYRLTGQCTCVFPQHKSPLYHPPVMQTLREIMQGEPTSRRCSFSATLVYKREQKIGEKNLLLFVTDLSLQDEQSSLSASKTLPLYVSPSCFLQSFVSQAITTPELRPTLIFRDALIEQGQILLCGESVVQLDLEHMPTSNTLLPRSVLLDELSLESPPRSLCTLTGVVVDVDENSAFSWPTCCQCGSDCLEVVQNKQEEFLCVTCGVEEKPAIKMQLEVYISCPFLINCTVKVKLQQKTIMSLLNSTGCAKGYEVERVLGKKVGPLSAFIHVISKCSNIWMGLEEITL